MGAFNVGWGPMMSINDDLPNQFNLKQNYPNPFNPITTIEYSIEIPSIVNLTIFNLKGERIRSLIQARQNPGNWSIKWNGLDEYKTPVSTGIYICKLTVGEKSQNRKMFLLK